jgi:hypothetical protein
MAGGTAPGNTTSEYKGTAISVVIGAILIALSIFGAKIGLAEGAAEKLLDTGSLLVGGTVGIYTLGRSFLKAKLGGS